MRRLTGFALILGCFMLLLCGACASTKSARVGFWMDMYDGEPVSQDHLLTDLAEVDVIFIGETHTIQRHHDIQELIFNALAERGVDLALAMEQVEAPYQPDLDRFVAGEIDFDELANATDWANRWSNYEQYRGIVEAAARVGAPVIALNAKAETIRAVARKGLDGMDPELRKELPKDIKVDDPMYIERLARIMPMHGMGGKSRMLNMFHAQMGRDEMMASKIAEFLGSEAGCGRTVIVLCGSGHVSHGLGTPDRLRNRLPEVKDRIIVQSVSGDLELSDMAKAMAKRVVITHEDLRQIDKTLADYVHVVSPKE